MYLALCQLFSLYLDNLDDIIQMEMVELQCDDGLRGKFLAASDPLTFFKDHHNLWEHLLLRATIQQNETHQE